MTSDIILIGAGRDPQTKELRRQQGHQRRTFWIGPIHIRSGMRFPVTLDFVKEHFEQLSEGIKTGNLLVSYKFDAVVDADELRTIAFGSAEELAAYEDKTAAELQATADELRAKSDALAKEQADLRAANQLAATASNLQAPASPEGDEDEDDRGDEELGDEEEEDVAPAAKPVLTGQEHDPQDNMEGSHAMKNTSPQDLADGLAADNTEEPYVPSGNSVPPDSDPNRQYPRLPDGWKNAPKAELLQYCQQRNIDTSDMPSNKVLRERLEASGG